MWIKINKLVEIKGKIKTLQSKKIKKYIYIYIYITI